MFLCLLEMPIYGRTYAIPFLLRLFYIAIHQGLSTTTVEPTYHRGMRFHFKDNGKVCAGPKCCRTDDDARPWCSTKVYANGKHMKGNFQYCKPCSAGCVPPNGRCIFPFKAPAHDPNAAVRTETPISGVQQKLMRTTST